MAVTDLSVFYHIIRKSAVQICLTDISERRLYQDIANEVADGIYIIDSKTYDLLYANESCGPISAGVRDADGQKMLQSSAEYGGSLSVLHIACRSCGRRKP